METKPKTPAVAAFNPNEVAITYTLNINQVNVILSGMGKLPREATDGFFEHFRGHALTTMQAAEAEHAKAAAPEPKGPTMADVNKATDKAAAAVTKVNTTRKGTK